MQETFAFILILNIMTIALVYSLQCGHSHIPFRIVGGNETAKLQYPWMALMRVQHVNQETNKTNHLIRCDASLIDDQWLVTAAHCFNKQINSTLVAVLIKLGAHNVSVHEPLQVDIEAEKYIVDPLYNHTVGSKHDIAMVKLPKKLDLIGTHKYLEPICLPEANLPVRQKECYITGWGRTGTNQSVSDVLKHAKVTLIDSNECKIRRIEVDDSEVCAGYLGVSTCRGDSGGPLQCPTDSGIWVHEGIDSYGKATCGSGVPTVFTKTEKFVDWINKIRKDN